MRIYLSIFLLFVYLFVHRCIYVYYLSINLLLYVYISIWELCYKYVNACLCYAMNVCHVQCTYIMSWRVHKTWLKVQQGSQTARMLMLHCFYLLHHVQFINFAYMYIYLFTFSIIYFCLSFAYFCFLTFSLSF